MSVSGVQFSMHCLIFTHWDCVNILFLSLTDQDVSPHAALRPVPHYDSRSRESQLDRRFVITITYYEDASIVGLYSKSLNWYCVQIVKLGEWVCGCRCMHASGTLSCSIADVFSLMWDSGELPGKTWPYEAMFSWKTELFLFCFAVLLIPNNSWLKL